MEDLICIKERTFNFLNPNTPCTGDKRENIRFHGLWSQVCYVNTDTVSKRILESVTSAKADGMERRECGPKRRQKEMQVDVN